MLKIGKIASFPIYRVLKSLAKAVNGGCIDCNVVTGDWGFAFEAVLGVAVDEAVGADGLACLVQGESLASQGLATLRTPQTLPVVRLPLGTHASFLNSLKTEKKTVNKTDIGVVTIRS